jgi:hypothetical protein
VLSGRSTFPNPILFSCSIFGDESYLNNSNVDYLIGTEESGKIKRQMNYSDSEDEMDNSDITFEYQNDRLIRKNTMISLMETHHMC